jgi:acyl carrier protein/tetratricopeptide (TPR) repeat protein
MLKSSAHSLNDKAEDAMATAVQAQEIFADVTDKPREAFAWQTIAQLHISNRQFDVATFSQEKSLELFKAIGKKTEIVKSMYEVANLHLKLKNHKEGEKIVLQLGRYSYFNTEQEIARQCLFIDVCLVAREVESEKNPRLAGEVVDKAFRASMKAISLANGVDDKRCKGLAALGRSRVVFAMNQVESALESADQAARHLRSCGSYEARQKESQALAFQAHITLKMGKTPQAEQLVQQASDLAREFSDWRGFEMALEVLELIEQAQKAQEARALAAMAAGADFDFSALPKAAGDAAAPSMVIVEAPKETHIEAAVMEKKIMSMMIEMFDTDEDMHMDTEVMEMGLDSLMSLEFVGKLAKEVKGIHLSPTLLFDYPSIRSMGEHIEDESKAALGL